MFRLSICQVKYMPLARDTTTAVIVSFNLHVLCCLETFPNQIVIPSTSPTTVRVNPHLDSTQPYSSSSAKTSKPGLAMGQQPRRAGPGRQFWKHSWARPGRETFENVMGRTRPRPSNHKFDGPGRDPSFEKLMGRPGRGLSSRNLMGRAGPRPMRCRLYFEVYGPLHPAHEAAHVFSRAGPGRGQ